MLPTRLRSQRDVIELNWDGIKPPTTQRLNGWLVVARNRHGGDLMQLTADEIALDFKMMLGMSVTVQAVAPVEKPTPPVQSVRAFAVST